MQLKFILNITYHAVINAPGPRSESRAELRMASPVDTAFDDVK